MIYNSQRQCFFKSVIPRGKKQYRILYDPEIIQGVYFRSTRINTTITRKVFYRFLIGLKHFKEEVCRYLMVKTG